MPNFMRAGFEIKVISSVTLSFQWQRIWKMINHKSKLRFGIFKTVSVFSLLLTPDVSLL